MSKREKTVINIARELLFLNEGDRVPPMLEWSSKYNVSLGMVQNIFSEFQKEKIILCDKKGVLGTYVKEKNRKKIIEKSGFSFLVGVMPLPYSKRYEGLATGIKKSFQKFGIDYHFAHMSGSEVRIELLRKKVFDFAIISKLAYELLKREHKDIEIALSFGKESYVSKHVLLKSKNIKKINKIGFDKNSNDQKYLTNKYFEETKYEFVEIDSDETIELLKSNIVDAIIWNYDEIKEKDIDLEYEDLKDVEVLEKASEAVLVILNSNNELGEITKKIVDKEYIKKIQKKVINNEIIATYY